MTTCDYEGCDKPIRDEDKDLRAGAKKYCREHGEEIDNILRDGSPAEIMRWWIRSIRITDKAAKP